MNFALNLFSNLNSEFLLTAAILSVLGGVALLLVLRLGRNTIHQFRIRKYDALAFKIHSQWREIVRGGIPAETWRKNPMQCEIVQSIVIQEIGAAMDKDRPRLQEFLRSTGLIDLCIKKVNGGNGSGRRRGMLGLGAMRQPKAIAPLAEGPEGCKLVTRMAAVKTRLR